jgi:hypothetical protein
MTGDLAGTVRATCFLSTIIKMQAFAVAEDRAVSRKGALPRLVELQDDPFIPRLMKA